LEEYGTVLFLVFNSSEFVKGEYVSEEDFFEGKMKKKLNH